VTRADGLDRLPTEAELLRLAERRRPYRTLAMGYLFVSGHEPAPTA